MRVNRIVYRGIERQISRDEQIAAAERRFENTDAFVGESDVAAVFIESEMDAALQAAHDRVDSARQHFFVSLAACQDQWNACLVDQNRIGLVHQRGME